MARETIEEVLRIVAEVDPAIRSIEQLKQKIADLKKDAAKVDMAADPSGYQRLTYEIERLEAAEKRLTTATRQANEEMRRQKQVVSDTTRSSGMANASLLALGYAFSDMGQFGMGFSQGIRAIANNISSLSIGLVLMSAEARAAGVSLKTALLGALRGPYGLIVGLQLVIGLIDLWANSQRKAKETADSLTASIKDQALTFKVLQGAYDSAIGITQSEVALKTLNDEMGRSIKLTGDLTTDLENYGEFLRLTTEYTLQYAKAKELENKVKNKEIGFWQDLKLSLMDFVFVGGRVQGENKLIAESQNELNILMEDLIRIEKELQGLRKGEKDKEEGANKKANLIKKEKEAYYELNKEYDEHIQLMIKERELLESAVFKKEREYKISMMSKEQQEIEKVRQSYKELYDSLLSNYYIDYITYQEFNDKKARLKEIEQQQILEIEKRYAALRRAEQLKGVNDTLKAEDDARQKALDRIQQTEQAKMQFASNTVGFLISLNAAMAGASEEERRKAFKRDKALRVAQATIDTYAGANRAYATAPATPLGFFLAAAVVAAGLANVATIMGQNYDGGVMGRSRFARGVDGGIGQGIQGGYPYPMTGGSTMQPQFPDRTGSLDIRPRTQRLYVLEADITDAQQAQTDRGMKAGVF